MPTVLRILGFRFFFYINEGTEPPHIHIEKGEGYGKFWLDPIEEGYMHNFTNAEKRKVREIVAEYQEHFKSKWNEHFSQ